jgi:hypothetical protein
VGLLSVWISERSMLDLECSTAMITGKGELRFRVELIVANNDTFFG